MRREHEEMEDFSVKYIDCLGEVVQVTLIFLLIYIPTIYVALHRDYDI